MAAAVAAPVCSAAALSSKSSEISGAAGSLKASGGVPALALRGRRLSVQASRNRKISTKTPYGPTGGAKFKKGLDASGRKQTGKGVYQFTNKYGANVDGYSPIYVEEEWSTTGDSYAGGQAGLTLWALTLGALLLAGALLVYNTSALA